MALENVAHGLYEKKEDRRLRVLKVFETANCLLDLRDIRLAYIEEWSPP